jgi:Nif-specific regulatory protein
MVESGAFRKDLYYRLNVLSVFVPPLRDRPADILPLAKYFLQKSANDSKKNIRGFTEQAKEALLNYKWVGNIRELENCIVRACVVCRDAEIDEEHLLFQRSEDDIPTNVTLKAAVLEFKKRFLTRCLERHSWKQTVTAEALDIERSYLSKLIKDLGLREN